MAKTYFFSSRIFKISALALFLVMGLSYNAKACHGVALVGVTFTPTASGIVVTGSSDPATCGCGPYYMQVEVAFTTPCFTGLSPACGSPSWNSFPWYYSELNVPGYGPPNYTENCVLEPYYDITVPYADLCPGTSYVVRVREFVCQSSSAGGWSFVYTFTTPGVAVPVVVTTISDRYEACPGDTVHLNASATGGCSTTSFNYSWAPTTGLSNANIANPYLVVQNSNTIYTVSITGQCGNPFTVADDTVGINVGPPPIPGSTSALPASICSGGSSVVTVSGQDPNSLIQWEVSPNGISWFNLPGANSSTYNTGPLSTSLYYHAIIYGSGWWPGSGCGSTTSAPVQVIVTPSPQANAGANTTICNGSCTNLTATGGVSYTWQPGNQNGSAITVCPTAPTTYTVTVTDSNGCTAMDDVLVSTSSANVTASPDVNICTGASTILFASGSNGTTYSWTPNNGSLTGANTANPTATPGSTTTYTVTATNSIGCTATDSVMVTITPAPPLTVSNDTSMCSGGSAVLTASGATTYSWQPGSGTGSSITVNPGTTTTYTVTGNNNNCISYDSVTVSINPPPYVYAGPDFSVCRGSQATMNVATTGNSYLWLPTSGIIGSNTTQTIIAAPTVNTSYTVAVSGIGGCISTDTINVSVNTLPTVNATTPDNSICVGLSTTVNATGASSYSWIPTTGLGSPTAGSSTANPSTTTTYQVIGTDANGCMDTASIIITVNPLPAVYITSTPTECGDTTGALINSGVTTGTAPFVFTINSVNYTTLPTNLIGDDYTIVTTDANGCTSTQVVPVQTINTSFVNGAANPIFGTYPLPVGFTSTGSSGLTDWFWDFGDGSGNTANTQNSTFTYTSPGHYTVVLTAWNDNFGCAVYDTLWIEVVEEAVVVLPNVFTPNSDGTNDAFNADISGVKEVNIQVFNRWGAEVFEAKQTGLSPSPQSLQLWNGKTNGGNISDDGVYYYVISAVGYDTKDYSYAGFVHVLK
ncbi:MAG: gliding motility-associated C-terminal domain-containing protein [Bacteroidia bacterium]